MFDLVVLGGGPAGYVGAVRAAQLGAKVAVIEADKVGGTCLNRGCIPTKALVESARLWTRRHAFTALGLKVTGVSFDLPTAVDRKDQIVSDLGRGVESLLRSYDIQVVHGQGAVTSRHEMAVAGQTLQAENLLIATGSRVAMPPIPGIENAGVVTSDQVLTMTNQPERLVIIGGGVIGVEFASIFAAAGSKVTLVEAMDRILPGADAELAALMVKELGRFGVTVRTGATVRSIEGVPGAMQVVLAEGEPATGDVVLVATGRRPNLAGLEALDLTTAQGGVVTDAHILTSVAGVAAAGDVVSGRPMLAHVAYREAEVAAENLMGHNTHMDYRAVPQCIFGLLDLAQVGLTEAEARAHGYDVQVGRFPMSRSGRAMTMGEANGLVKVVAEARYGAILGVHILAPHAAELLGEATLAISLEATVDELAETLHMHPTLSEGVLEATLDVRGAAVHLPRRR